MTFTVILSALITGRKGLGDVTEPIWTQDIDGLIIGVERAWLHPPPFEGGRTDTPPILAVALVVTNKTENKKFDLSRGVRVRLTDEFGNVYALRAAPHEFAAAVETKTPFHPSLYPSESYRKLFFFEPPLKSARLLTLDVSLDFFREGTKQIHLMIPAHKITPFDRESFRAPTDDDLVIRSPKDGLEIAPGKRVLVTVDLSEDVPVPDKIYVLAPPHTLVDEENRRRYIVLVPKNISSEAYEIAVMALWEHDGEPMTITKAVTLKIKSDE